MENWDLAQKYAEISANAYGTAAEKMTAYTDSIEAAQNRVTASIEDFAMRLNSSNLIKAFYNTISYLIDNLDKLAATIGLVIVAGNASNIARAASGGLVALGGKITGFGTSINMAGRTFAGSGIKGAARGLKNAVIDSAGQAYLQKSMALYEQALLNRIASLDAETQMSAKVLQTQMLSNKADIQAVQMEYLTTNMTEQEYQAKVKATTSYNTLSPALQAEIAATENLTKVKNNAAAKQAVLDNVNASNAGRASGTRQYINNMIGGVGGMAGGMLGSVGGYNFGEALGEGWGGTGGILGGMIGMYAGGKIGSGLGSYADNYAKAYEKIGLKIGAQLGAGYNKGVAGAIQRVGATGSAIFNSFGGWAGIASIGITAATTFWSWYMKKQEEKIQEAKDQFNELKDSYDVVIGATSSVSEYEDLIRGVDALGNNVSLTEEEYQNFLDASNALAEAFPQLVIRTDEAGNSIVGLDGKVQSVTEAVDEYTKSLKEAADAALLNPTLFKANYQEASEQYREARESYDAYSNFGLVAGQNSETTSLINQRTGFEESATFGYLNTLQGEAEKETIKAVLEALENAGFNTRSDTRMYETSQGNQVVAGVTIEIDDEHSLEQAESVIKSITNQAGTFQAQMNSAVNSMSDETLTRLKTLVPEYDELNSSQQQFLQDMAKSVDLGIEDEEQYIQEFSRVINKATEIANDSNYASIFETAEGDTIEAAQNARKLLGQALKSAFGDSYDDTELKIIADLGFEVDDEGNIADTQNIWRQIEGLVGEGNTGFGSDAEFNKKYTEQEGQKAFEYFRDGWLQASSGSNNEELFDKMLDADKAASSITEAAKQMFDFSEIAETFEDDLNNFYKEIYGSGLGESELKGRVGELFPGLPENVREAILSGAEEAANSSEMEDQGEVIGEQIEKGLTSFNNTAIQNSLSALGTLTADIFEGVELDGIIDSWQELKDTLESVAEGYELLKNAQAEQDKYGNLSVSTVLDLLTTNADYAKALQVTENGIELKTDAERIMAEVQLKAIQANLQATIAENENEIATLKNTIQQINNGEEIATTSDIVIQTAEAKIEALNALTQVYAQLAAAAGAANAAERGEVVDIQSALASALGSVATIEGPEGIDTSKWSQSEKDAKIAALESQIADLEESNSILQEVSDDIQYTLDSGVKLSTMIGEKGWYERVEPDADAGEDAAEAYERLLDALEGIIDKEWEAMQVFDKMTGKVTGETQYFAKMQNLLEAKISFYKNQMNEALSNDEMEEYYDWQAKFIKAEVQLANLDDERIQDEIELAEAKNYSLQTIIKLNQELVKTADTEEDRVEYQNQLNEAIREEFEERKRIREFEQDFIDRAMDRQSGTSWSSGGVYDELVNMKRQSYEQDAQDALRLRENWYQYYVGTYMDEGMSWDEAKKRAEQAQEVQEATQEYLEAIDNQAQLVIDSVTDKLDEIQQKIDDLEKTKPQEWTSIDQIKQFSEETIGLLEAKIPELKEGLEDVSILTDEQIQDLVNQINEATQALFEAKYEMAQEIQNYQESQFSAVEWFVEGIIDDLTDQIDDIADAYEPLIDQLEEINDEKERSAELDDLLMAKQRALQDKSRVYREG